MFVFIKFALKFLAVKEYHRHKVVYNTQFSLYVITYHTDHFVFLSKRAKKGH